MRSNFDNPMKLEKGGAAEACGPLEWNGETAARVTVTITQDKVEGTASGSFDAPEDEWMLEVRPSDPNKKFHKGRAQARGQLTTVPAATAAENPFPWQQDVDLDPKAPDDD